MTLAADAQRRTPAVSVVISRMQQMAQPRNYLCACEIRNVGAGRQEMLETGAARPSS